MQRLGRWFRLLNADDALVHLYWTVICILMLEQAMLG